MNTKASQISPSADKVLIFTTALCGFCHAAKRMLNGKGIQFEEIAADGNAAIRTALREQTGQTTVPQIWIGERHVGGYTDLVALDRSSELDELLASLSNSEQKSGQNGGQNGGQNKE